MGDFTLRGMVSATFPCSRDHVALGSGSSWKKKEVLEFANQRLVNQTFSSDLRQGSAFLGLILAEEVNSAAEGCDPGTVSMENGTARKPIYPCHSGLFLTRQLRTMSGRI